MSKARSYGVTLVELMIGLALGLLLVLLSGHFYLATLQSTKTALGLARIQESGRTALELIGRDIRGAGDSLCDTRHPVGNLLSDRQREFWTSFGAPLVGSGGSDRAAFSDPALDFGDRLGDRIPQTPALRLWNVIPLAVGATARVSSGQAIPVSGSQVPRVGDATLICDFEMTAIFRATSSGGELGHSTPANCMDTFVAPGICLDQAPAESATHRFGVDSAFGAPRQVRWFLGRDELGVPSLFRQELVDGAVVASGAVVTGVSKFELTYLTRGSDSYVTAERLDGASWGDVKAVNVQLELEAPDAERAHAGIARNFYGTFSVRSRDND